MAKVLILAGDAAEDLETMFIKYRLAEADYEPHIAAPTMRPIKLVVHDFEPDWDTYVERQGRTCPVDVAFAEVDPADYAALVIPGGRAPEFIRVDPDVARIVGALLRRGEAGRHALPRPSGAGGARPPARPAQRRLRPARARHRDGGRRVRRRPGGGRREHGLVPRLGRPGRVVARVPRAAGSLLRGRLTPGVRRFRPACPTRRLIE